MGNFDIPFFIHHDMLGGNISNLIPRIMELLTHFRKGIHQLPDLWLLKLLILDSLSILDLSFK